MMTATERERSSRSRPSGGHRGRAAVAAAVRPVAEGLADASGLYLWGLTFVREAGRDVLRVACDRVGGIGSDELATFSEQLSRELDRSDAIPGERSYVLEVTSPGAERKLETPDHFRVCVGRAAKVTLRDGRAVEGPIRSVSDRAVEIDGDGETVRALFDDIARARLVVKL